MRFFLLGPRLLHGLVRPGISFGPEDFPTSRKPLTAAAALPEDSFIYVAKGNDGLCTIGMTGDPRARLAQLNAGSAHPLEFAWIGVPQNDSALIKQDANAALAAHSFGTGNSATGTEWFKVIPETAVGAVCTAASRRGQSILAVTPERAEQIRIATLATEDSSGSGFAARFFIGLLKALVGAVLGLIFALILWSAITILRG
jgi:hypothetical protein